MELLPSHHFVLGLRAAFQSSDKLYMLTEYCSGGELFFHLKKARRFSEGMVRFYSAELALALRHLHKHHIIYRDVKPEVTYCLLTSCYYIND